MGGAGRWAPLPAADCAPSTTGRQSSHGLPRQRHPAERRCPPVRAAQSPAPRSTQRGQGLVCQAEGGGPGRLDGFRRLVGRISGAPEEDGADSAEAGAAPPPASPWADWSGERRGRGHPSEPLSLYTRTRTQTYRHPAPINTPAPLPPLSPPRPAPPPLIPPPAQARTRSGTRGAAPAPPTSTTWTRSRSCGRRSSSGGARGRGGGPPLGTSTSAPSSTSAASTTGERGCRV